MIEIRPMRIWLYNFFMLTRAQGTLFFLVTKVRAAGGHGPCEVGLGDLKECRGARVLMAFDP